MPRYSLAQHRAVSAQNIDCGYSLEPSRQGGSNEYHNLCYEQKHEKYQSFFNLKIFSFQGVKFSIYLNRRVFVMSKCDSDWDLNDQINSFVMFRRCFV